MMQTFLEVDVVEVDSPFGQFLEVGVLRGVVFSSLLESNEAILVSSLMVVGDVPEAIVKIFAVEVVVFFEFVELRDRSVAHYRV